MKANTTGWPLRSWLAIRCPSWLASVKLGTGWPAGRSAPAQPSVSSSAVGSGVCCSASATPATAATAHRVRAISVRRTRAASTPLSLKLDVGTHDDRALVGQVEDLDRVRGVARDRQEELLAPRGHAGPVGRDDRD